MTITAQLGLLEGLLPNSNLTVLLRIVFCSLLCLGGRAYAGVSEHSSLNIPSEYSQWHALQAYNEKDYDTARKIWEFRATQADHEAHYALGHLYVEGYGVQIDLRRAMDHFLVAAKSDHIWSFAELWALQALGVNVPPETIPEPIEFYTASPRTNPGLEAILKKQDTFNRLQWHTVVKATYQVTEILTGDRKKVHEVHAEISSLSWYAMTQAVASYDEYLKEVEEPLLAGNGEISNDFELINDVWFAERGYLPHLRLMGGKFDNSDSQFFRSGVALAMLRTAANRGDIDSMRDYAIYLDETGEYQAAISLMRTAVERAEYFFGKKSNQAFLNRGWLVYFNNSIGDSDSAENISLAQFGFLSHDEDVARYVESLSRLGSINFLNGNYEQAWSLSKKAYQIADQHDLKAHSSYQFIASMLLWSWSGHQERAINGSNYKSFLKEYSERYPASINGKMRSLEYYEQHGPPHLASQLLEDLLAIDIARLKKRDALDLTVGLARYYHNQYRKNSQPRSLEQARSQWETAKTFTDTLPPLDTQRWLVNYNLASLSVTFGNCEEFLRYEDEALNNFKDLRTNGIFLGSIYSMGRYWFIPSMRNLLDSGLRYCFSQDVLDQKTFEYVQLLNTSVSSETIVKFTQRLTPEDLQTQKLIRLAQELEIQKNQLKVRIQTRLSSSSSTSDKAIVNLQAELQRTSQKLAETERNLNKRPQHVPIEEMRKIPTLSQVQTSLASKEAVIVLFDLEPEGVYWRQWGGEGRPLLISTLITPDSVTTHWVGQDILPLTGSTKIAGTMKNSPAAKGGFKKGDIIKSINDIPVSHTQDIVHILDNAGRKLTRFEILRNSEQHIFEIKKEELVDPEDGQMGEFFGFEWETYDSLSDAVKSFRRMIEPTVGNKASSFDPTLANDFFYMALGSNKMLQELENITHLFVVSDGSFSKIPFHLLMTDYFDVKKHMVSTDLSDTDSVNRGFTVTEEDTAESLGTSEEFIDYRSAPWLARRVATSYVPSLQALVYLRNNSKSSLTYEKRFVGFGNPTLKGNLSSDTFTNAGSLFVRGIASNASLNQLPPLPETADELMAIAEAIGGSASDVFLGPAATEANVKNGQWGKVEVIGFATHGLLAGEGSGLDEPGLVLTPPEVASREDDGILTASEIAQLRLNADWVLLSACNTAIGEDYDPGGLPTLSNAFFFAGARALLASYWPVWSKATATLMKQIFEEKSKNSVIGKSESVRRGMMAMLDKSEGRFTHPQYWAPFMVIGDGG
jgi:hypothetical protein